MTRGRKRWTACGGDFLPQVPCLRCGPAGLEQAQRLGAGDVHRGGEAGQEGDGHHDADADRIAAIAVQVSDAASGATNGRTAQ
jgi:hypothetical protein